MELRRQRMNPSQEKMLSFASMKPLQILTAMLDRNQPMGIQEIADETGLSKSTVHRIIQELLACGYVVKDESTKNYALGLSLWLMSQKAKETNYLQLVAEDEMTRLNNLSGETIHLIALDREEGVYVGKKEAQCQIQLKSRVGWHIPLTCTSGGKAILANKSREWVENYLQTNPLKKYTDHTITDKKLFFEELDRIKAQGYSLDDHEHNADIVCIAAPIFDRDGNVIGTIGISSPDYKFPVEKALSFADDVMKSARKISEKLRG